MFYARAEALCSFNEDESETKFKQVSLIETPIGHLQKTS